MAGKEDKATRYIAQLYDARCSNRWRDIPELSRKTEKHAPSRKCLTLSARTEALIRSKPGAEGVQEADRLYTGELASAISKDTNKIDVLDGEVSCALIHFCSSDADRAITWVSEPLQHRLEFPASGEGQESWAAVVVLRGTLIRGLSFEAQKNDNGAATTYRAIIGYLSKVVALPNLCPALRQLTEELLVHICLFFAAATETRSMQPGEAMATFHLISQLMDKQNGRLAVPQGAFTRNTPRQFWCTYYASLTGIIKEGLVYHPSPPDRDHETVEHRGLLGDEEYDAARRHQRGELQRVERNYESILIEETKFPKAEQSNKEVRDWVELVMTNWRTLSGPTWNESQIGDGGQIRLTRNVLEILYRAATKTFHSTQILRHLFTVHTFLGEFDLALKAFDTYVEILWNGKAREERSGDAGLDLDDDDTAIRLVVEAIRVMARYGDSHASKKAYGTGSLLQEWIANAQTPSSPEGAGHSPSTSNKPFSNLSKDTLALAYRAIGISEATWSRHTYDASLREELQKRATTNLRKSLQQGIDDSHSVESLYALGLVFAEMRQIPEALMTIKRAIQVPLQDSSLASPDGVVTRDGDLAPGPEKVLPLRHLQALLMTSSEDYDSARATCAEAVSIVPYVKDVSIGNTSRTRHADVAFSDLFQSSPGKWSSVNDVGLYEKQAILETEMTHVALVGVLEGASNAVRLSNKLMAIYSRLFGIVDVQPKLPLNAAPFSPPQSSRGTVRSIFGRPRTARKTMYTEQPPTGVSSGFQTANPSRPTTMQTTAPSIKVTGEAANNTRPSSRRPESMANGNTTEMRSPRRSLSMRRKALGSMKGKNPSLPEVPLPASAEPKSQIQPAGQAPNIALNGEMQTTGDVPVPGLEKSESGAQDLGDAAHNMHHKEAPPPPGHNEQPPSQDTRLPTAHPKTPETKSTPRPVAVQELRHKKSLLIKLWIFIARLYMSATMFNDAHDAVQEARELVEDLELEASRDESSVKHFKKRGWGGGKSIEELWADVWAVNGDLFKAEDKPHDAIESYERALSHLVDHPEATIGLSNILVKIFRKEISYEKADKPLAILSRSQGAENPQTSTEVSEMNKDVQDGSVSTPSSRNVPSTLELYRLATRDRAYGLLSSLTKLGFGWDNSDAWLSLSRAYEESGQLQKSKEALWWTLELEDTKPIRHWRDVSPGGYVL